MKGLGQAGFEALVAASPRAIVILDRDRRVRMWNSMAEQLFAIEAKAILGRRLPDDLGLPDPQQERRLIGGEVITEADRTSQRRDGRGVSFDLWAAPIRNEQGKVVGIIEVLNDTTDRQRERIALKEQTEFVQLLERVAVAANESSSLDAAAQRVLDEICAHTGWPVGHVYLARHRGAEVLFSTTLWHFDDPERFTTFRRVTESFPMPVGVGLPGRVLHSGKAAWIMDVTVDPNFPRARVAQDIGVRAAFAFPILVEKAVVGVLEFFSPHSIEPDEALLESMSHVGTQLGRVVERSWAEAERAALLAREQAAHAEAAAAQRRMAFLYEASGALMAESFDLSSTLGVVAGVTVPRFADWCILKLVDEVAYRQATVVHADPEKAALAERLCQSYRTGKDHPLEAILAVSRPLNITHFSQLGLDESSEIGALVRELGMASALVVPLRARDRLLGSVAFVSARRTYTDEDAALADDLGHRIALAVDNARLYQHAQGAVRSREDMLAIVSHDLRTPVSSISTTTELLLSDLEIQGLQERNRERIQRIRRAAVRIGRLLGTLLDAASIEAGRLHVSPERVCVTELLRDGMDVVESMAATREIRMVAKPVEEGPLEVRADRERVIQVLSNLLGNAIKFTPGGAEVTVEAELRGEEVLFSVRDNCPGIPPEQLPHLFDRYWRAPHSERSGAGLGLFIAKGIVEAHGGRLLVESTPDHPGCVFSFTLPGRRTARRS